MAEWVTRDLARGEAAGSSPVYRSVEQKRIADRISFFVARSEVEPGARNTRMIAIWYIYGTIVTNIDSKKRMGLHEKNCYNVRWLG